ncbi:hypothetical protein O3P69_001020 [Scylla paramamosain]|uniref:Uncharacterized protein n=1 Tax=Scylla paramamosain TaxID=85552 RepID=A0AAW0UN78_SCYPA
MPIPQGDSSSSTSSSRTQDTNLTTAGAATAGWTAASLGTGAFLTPTRGTSARLHGYDSCWAFLFPSLKSFLFPGPLSDRLDPLDDSLEGSLSSNDLGQNRALPFEDLAPYTTRHIETYQEHGRDRSRHYLAPVYQNHHEEVCATKKNWDVLKETVDMDGNPVVIIMSGETNQTFYSYKCIEPCQACKKVTVRVHLLPDPKLTQCTSPPAEVTARVHLLPDPKLTQCTSPPAEVIGNSRCKQRYTYVKMLHYLKESPAGPSDSRWGFVEVPSHCACELMSHPIYDTECTLK